MDNWYIWLGGKRGWKNGGPHSFISRPTKIESFQFKVKTWMKMSGNIVDEIAQANVQSFFVLFFSVSLVIRFLSSFVQSFDPFFFCVRARLSLPFLLCLSFLRFFTFSFLSYFDIFFSFSFIMCIMFLFSNS